MSYWAYYGWRWIVLAIFAYWGYTIDGWDGAFWMSHPAWNFRLHRLHGDGCLGQADRAFSRPQNLNQSVNFNTVATVESRRDQRAAAS